MIIFYNTVFFAASSLNMIPLYRINEKLSKDFIFKGGKLLFIFHCMLGSGRLC